MKRKSKKVIAMLMTFSLMITATGCGGKKKDPKPTPKSTAKIDKGNADASGKGEGQADVPIIISSTAFSKNFNPFTVRTIADQNVVDLTQINLIKKDRTDKIVYNGIDGVMRDYKEKSYTYYGATNLNIVRNEKTTTYKIKIRDDLSFSDGVKLTIDDVIFSIYAFCDKSYQGKIRLKDMPIVGLLNYQANNKKAEKISAKKVTAYRKKMPAKLKKWVNKRIIQDEIKNGAVLCNENYQKEGYESAKDCFVERYDLKTNANTHNMKELKKLAIKKYEKAGYQLLAKNVYFNSSYFNTKIENQARIYLAASKAKKGKKIKKVSKISGIKRISNYEMTITTKGYNKEMSSSLQIPVCALHYYGNTSKYNYKKGKFGFKRGDISSLTSNQSAPVGAGPYRFVKYEKKIAYFTSNEMYYLGCPHIAFLELKDMSETLKQTRIMLKEKQKERENNEQDSQKADATDEPQPTINPLAEVTELAAGTVDVMTGIFDASQLQWIQGANSNEQMSGSTLIAETTGDGNYQYIGIHGKNVSVGKKSTSDASISLRKALAVIFSISREQLVQKEGILVKKVNAPVCADSWVSTQSTGDTKNAFNITEDGKEIYQEDESDTTTEETEDEAVIRDKIKQKEKSVMKAARAYLKKAGYEFEQDKVTKAPRGAKTTYTVAVANGKDNRMYPVLQRASELLKEIGITLKIQSVSGMAKLQRKLLKGKQQIWVGMRSVDDFNLKRYTGKNIFGVKSQKLNQNVGALQGIMTSQERKADYQLCFDKIMDLAIEVPVCEYQIVSMFSTERISGKSVPKDCTSYYNWMNDIQKVNMK